MVPINVPPALVGCAEYCNRALRWKSGIKCPSFVDSLASLKRAFRKFRFHLDLALVLITASLDGNGAYQEALLCPYLVN